MENSRKYLGWFGDEGHWIDVVKVNSPELSIITVKHMISAGEFGQIVQNHKKQSVTLGLIK